jgi:hypothetical protein
MHVNSTRCNRPPEEGLLVGGEARFAHECDKVIFTTNVAIVIGTGGVGIGAEVVVAGDTHCPGVGVQSLIATKRKLFADTLSLTLHRRSLSQDRV